MNNKRIRNTKLGKITVELIIHQSIKVIYTWNVNGLGNGDTILLESTLCEMCYEHTLLRVAKQTNDHDMKVYLALLMIIE